MISSGVFCLFVAGQKLAQSTQGNEPSDFNSNSPQPSASSIHPHHLHARVQLFQRVLGSVINGISPQKFQLHPSLLFLKKAVNFHIIACIVKTWHIYQTILLSLGALSGYFYTGNCAISMQDDAIILYFLPSGPMSFPMAQAEMSGTMTHKIGNGLSLWQYPVLIGECVYSYEPSIQCGSSQGEEMSSVPGVLWGCITSVGFICQMLSELILRLHHHSPLASSRGELHQCSFEHLTSLALMEWSSVDRACSLRFHLLVFLSNSTHFVHRQPCPLRSLKTFTCLYESHSSANLPSCKIFFWLGVGLTLNA